MEQSSFAPEYSLDGIAWTPGHAAVHVERLVDPAGKPSGAMLRHPSYPFVELVAAGDDFEQRLRELALAYLERLKETVELGEVIGWLRENDPFGFGWLDLRWGHDVAEDQADPRLSFSVERVLPTTKAGVVKDRSIVLLAGNRLRNGDDQVALGYGVGLRIVMHVATADSPTPGLVRITGASLAGLRQAIPPKGAEVSFLRLGTLFELKKDVETQFNFQPESATLEGVWWGAEGGYRLTGMARLPGDSRVYAWGARSAARDKERWLERDYLVEVATHATAQPIEVFQRDPASSGPMRTAHWRRPTRQAEPLNEYRGVAGRLPPDEPPPSDPLALRKRLFERPQKRFEVRQSRLGNPTGDPGQIQWVDSKTLPLRSDQLAAEQAYVRGDEFFERLDVYGLRPELYFKLARLPLLLRHRAPLKGAADGMAVNAQVGPDDPGASLLPRRAGLVRPQLQVRFGAANLTHRDLLPNDSGDPRLQYLGLAADARWAWHEFGHVLAFASTGRLEFPFAHSAGDALAAIVADPGAVHRREPAARGHTFPWVRINRRHDREARLGWCWCGRRNARRFSPPSGEPFVYTGYFAEQLLSTSLFRLYRSIGGDTFGAAGAATPAMHSASDYAVYLVMRATLMLGPHTVLPALSVDHFVSALIDADIGTVEWDITATWHEPAPPLTRRLGGMLGKVIRWAFERQGLDATDDPLEARDGEGRPPKFDVYIPGRDERAQGDYEPVALETLDDLAANQPWHAADDAIVVDAAGVRVRVRNRGREDADQVQVEVWATPVGQPRAWQKLGPTLPAQASIPKEGGTQDFVIPTPLGTPVLAPGDYVFLAVATCPGDRANSDPLAGLPCAWTSGAPPADDRLLTDLVANDNNLGLRVLTVPA